MTCTVYKELVKELTLKLVTIDFMDRVERWSSIFGNFHIAVIGVDEPLAPGSLFKIYLLRKDAYIDFLYILSHVLIISDLNGYIFSVEL